MFERQYATLMTRHSSLRVVLATLLVVIVPFLVAGWSIEGWVIARLDDAPSNPPLAALVIVLLLVADVVLPIPSGLVSIASRMVLGSYPALRHRRSA
jgi:hypothetical protein